MKTWLSFFGQWLWAYMETNYQEAYWDAVARQKACYWLLFSKVDETD